MRSRINCFAFVYSVNRLNIIVEYMIENMLLYLGDLLGGIVMFNIQRDNNVPIYQQIYEQIKYDILLGNLPEGSRLNSIRVLASEIQVSRNSVENAYGQLVLEGYITSSPGSGYIVNKLEFYLNQEIPANTSHMQGVSKTADYIDNIRYNFQYGGLEAASFPDKLWRKYVAYAFEESNVQQIHSHTDKNGNIELRQQIRQYLYRSRGVNCKDEQVVICSGTQSVLEIIVRLFPKVNSVAMEEPCYDAARAVFKSNGYKIMPVLVGENGIDLSQLESLDASMVHIAPSHQFPTGAVMPIHERVELLNLARKRNMIIIEDDYDSEFRYRGRPIPSLQSIDNSERVIYIGTFSKALSSDLRISYMVLPTWLLSTYDEKYNGYQCTVPLIEQVVLAKFMKEGYWEKHLRKICLYQKKKHDTLINAIKKIMGNKVNIYGHHAGLHILLKFTDEQKEEVLAQKALDYGVYVSSVRPFWLNKDNYPQDSIVLGYGKIKEEDIVPAVELLNKIWFT